MNQSILFPELEQWQAPSSTITFPAMVNGFQITCAIRLADLQVLATRAGAEGVPQAPLTMFQALRWQLEEYAEREIIAEAYDDQGWVWISACER
ncbi:MULTISPECIES: DUF1488 domain-containing protein [Edwardsiella]|uniref:DUF1488 domain-containing protein n=1 Tax=Edwardsiella anguillarum TaxID=1821960 RepID=A0ABY8SEA0_9GAMM|nr:MULTISPECIES: DUF1488 domain-containing protein [Edwardsiella]AKR78969.1 DUF1488 domain-containing protein [Edwardsiella sp. LADL05-105]KAB0586100.1 DUF1488 domain-containing protein [Edwardsiella anguillarum]UOU79357.1 DUF1488 domain-containing protein [Edwardsiella anguillarum]WHP83602.1 DUF1488 domain-containing protein [Edwardsiella anguillarum]WHP87393.1 DUF1488 domain-containing protein [Edwardsiella anguillarum]